MASESDSPPSPPSSDSSSSSPSKSSNSSPSGSPNSSPPPPPPPPSDDQQSPPPPPSDKDSGSDSPSSSPPQSSNSDVKSPNPPPPPYKSGQDSRPPPPPKKLSPPGVRSSSESSPSSKSSSSSSSSSSSRSKSNSHNGPLFNVPAIIGIAGGAALLLLVMVLLFISCRRKRRRSEGGKPGKPDGDYFKPPTHPNQQWNNEINKGVYVLNIPPPPGRSPMGWAAPTPPQPSSGEASTGTSSGPYGPPMPPPHPSVAFGFNKSTFAYEELLIATGGFAHENLLGQGGYGYVHKGVLPNGKDIAVKSLKSTGGQGDREFQAEVDIISRVHHRHLVSLVGYCLSEDQKILVYEFVPNKTLEYHLHGKDRPVMPWNIRLKIAIGSAKGLAYLHEDCHPRIIHRDIKAANILIDNDFEAKVADFGLAKFTQDNNTHVSTRVMGTFGYLAPEYASSGKLTEKSDVFSYGVMLLELITGRPPVDIAGDYDDDSLVDWARPLCLRAMENGGHEGLVDSRLGNNYERSEMARMVACAAACVSHSARRRPKMSQIVRALEGDVSLDDLNEGVKAGRSSVGAVYDTGAYNADMERFRKLALDSGSASSEL